MAWEDLFLAHILKRGERYFKEGRVIGLTRKGGTYSAYVDGSGSTYRVSVRLNQNGLTQANCTCPYAQSGMYCKHMAAVLYALEPRKEAAVVLPILKVPEKEILRFTTKADYQRDQYLTYSQRFEISRLLNGMYQIQSQSGYEEEWQEILLGADCSINNFSCTCNEEQMFAAQRFCRHLNIALAAVNGKNLLLKNIPVRKGDFPLPYSYLLPVPPEETAAEKEVRLTRQKYQYYANRTAYYCESREESPRRPPLFQIEPPEEGGVELRAYFAYENDDDGEQQPVLYFKVGADFAYKIKNLSQFLNRVEEEEFYRYGQKLAFTHKRDVFTEEAWSLIRILRRCRSWLSLADGFLPLEKALPVLDELFDFFSENPGLVHDVALIESECEPDLRIQPLAHGFYQLDYSRMAVPLCLTERYGYRITGQAWERLVFPDILAETEIMDLLRYTYPEVIFDETLRPIIQALADRANGEREMEAETEALAFKLDLEKDSVRIEIDGGNQSKLAAQLAEALELSGCFLKNGAYYFSEVDQQWLNELTRELENYGEVWVSEELKAYHKVYRAAPALHVRQQGSVLKLDIAFNDI